MRRSWINSISFGVEQNDDCKVCLIDKHPRQSQSISLRNSKRLSAVVAGTAITGVLGLLSALRVNADASAAVESGSTLDEITVTAQKRVSTVQDTPISISAVSGADLQARGVSSLASLAQGTPGVSLKTEGPIQT